MNRARIVSAVLLVLLTSCVHANKSDLKFYVVSRDELSSSLTDSEIVSAAERHGRLAFDGDDVQGYNWQTHYVVLKKEAVPSLGAVTPESGGSALFKVSDEYALVITVEGKLIYVCGFKNGIKNPQIPIQPSVEDVDGVSFKITFDPRYASGTDPRFSSKLYSFLQNCGLLSAKTE